jgi:type VI secretion system protein ImpC
VHLAADLAAEPARVLEPGVFRIVICGDFSGSDASSKPPVAQRRFWRIDRDDVDTVLARIAPAARIELEPSDGPLDVSFATLEDFHPDRLIERLAVFQRLRALRREVASAVVAPPPSTPRADERPNAVAIDLTSGSLLDRIVDDAQTSASAQSGSSTTGAMRPGRPRDELTAFVARAVRSHVVPESTPEQRTLVAKVDDVITATMRVLLHHPRFQALESLWRGVDFLVRRLDTSESLQVYLVDVSRDELVADLAAGDAARSSVRKLLADRGDGAWTVLVGAYTFGPDDAPVLSTLAAVGQSVGAPWLAAASARVLGVPTLAGSDSDDWTADASESWVALRRSSAAPFVSLSAPRFLLRLPYGRQGEECSFDFEELGDDSHRGSFLWGNPAIAVALGVAGNAAEGGNVTGRSTIDHLPLHVTRIGGEPIAIPCAELLLSQHAVETMLDAGVTPLVSPRDGDTIVIPRVQSIGSPARAIPIRA